MTYLIESELEITIPAKVIRSNMTVKDIKAKQTIFRGERSAIIS